MWFLVRSSPKEGIVVLPHLRLKRTLSLGDGSLLFGSWKGGSFPKCRGHLALGLARAQALGFFTGKAQEGGAFCFFFQLLENKAFGVPPI